MRFVSLTSHIKSHICSPLYWFSIAPVTTANSDVTCSDSPCSAFLNHNHESLIKQTYNKSYCEPAVLLLSSHPTVIMCEVKLLYLRLSYWRFYCKSQHHPICHRWALVITSHSPADMFNRDLQWPQRSFPSANQRENSVCVKLWTYTTVHQARAWDV